MSVIVKKERPPPVSRIPEVPNPVVTLNTQSDNKTGLLFDEAFLLHEGPSDHPEKPLRVSSIMNALNDSGVAGRCVKMVARPALKEELLTTHTEEHIDSIRNADAIANSSDVVKEDSSSDSGSDATPAAEKNPLKAPYFYYGSDLHKDTYYNKYSSTAADLAVGGLIDLSEAVYNGSLQNALAVIRPPGHHAECCKMMGFCLYNNVAVAANVISSKYKCKILIVDWDVHHGNGIQNIFYENRNVLYFSVHRSDDGNFYPGTGFRNECGSGEGEGFNVNFPLPGPYLGDSEYVEIWKKVLIPIAKSFQPELIFISAGFDAALGDRLGLMEVTPACYAFLTQELVSISNGKVVLALEGGYNCNAISESFNLCGHVLLGDSVSLPDLTKPKISRTLFRDKPFYKDFSLMLQCVLEIQSSYWPCLSDLSVSLGNLSLREEVKNEVLQDSSVEEKKVSNDDLLVKSNESTSSS